MNARALQSVPQRGRSALISVLILSTIIFTSCSSKNGPISTDALNDIFRSGMSFDSGNSWSHGYSLDSSSTTWVHPTPSGFVPGDIALIDIIDSTTIVTLVTAFVTHTRDAATTMVPCEIELIMLDENEDVAYSDTFSGTTDANKTFCRHPVVEVTYERVDLEDTGYVRAHIVWSQLNETDSVEHWDLYYRYLVWEVTDSGITWSTPVTDETVNLAAINTTHHELQPDIGTYSCGNDIYLVYLLNDPAEQSPENDLIMGAVHLDGNFGTPGNWGTEYEISDDNSNSKAAPRTDAGMLSTNVSPQVRDMYAAVVWNEEDPDDSWQIFFTKWQVTTGPGTIEQISAPGENDETSFLPQIDITPDGESINQAIVTWTMVSIVEESVYPFVMITATPFLTNSIRMVTAFSRCSDVATYQLPDPIFPLPPPVYGRFGVSYYTTPDIENDWIVEVSGYTFEVDWLGEVVWFEYYTDVEVDGTACQWDEDHPFSGSTLCLRIPADPDEEDSWLGLAWIVDDSSDDWWDAYWEFGQIN